MSYTSQKWIRIQNNKALKAINAAGNGTVDLLKLDADDILQLLGTVKYSGYEIANKDYVTTGLSGKEPTISAASSDPTLKYWRGDKSWQSLTSDVATEGSTNKYFTDSRAKTAAVVDSLSGSQTDQAPSVASVKTELSAKIASSEKGAASGVCPLNSSSKVDTTYLPDSIVGALEYKGTFDASGGSYPSSPETGWYYVCSVAGTVSGKDYEVGDWAVYNGSAWDKIDNSDKVSSVNSQTGAVVLDTDDISEPETPTNKWFTDSRAKTAAVVNSTSGSETDQAASVSAMKSYVGTQIGNAIAGFGHEEFTLTGDDISNGYVDLAHVIKSGSQVISPEGGPIQKASNYSLSTVSSKTRVTFAGDLSANLEAGDILIVSYAY